MRKPQSAGRITGRGASSTRAAVSWTAAAGQKAAPDQRSVVNQQLAPVPESIIVGRWIAERACRQWRLAGALREVRQVVTELLANAVQHAGTPMVLTVSYREPWVMVAVRDGCPALPRRVLPGKRSSAGRGLLLVDAFAHAWGSARAADGKVVWATIAARPVAGGRAVPRTGVATASRPGIPFAGRLKQGVPPEGHPATVNARSFRSAG
ncbi:MAG: ATP-binding protein [Micromonosporaceae bacterium]|nr:ATP-binding protein [Micromonosporaceae bacterium]